MFYYFHFRKQIFYGEKNGSSVFSCPTTLAELRTNLSRKFRQKINFTRALSAITALRWTKTWKHKCFSIWEKPFVLQTVQLLLHTCWWPQDTHANPFRRKPFRCTQCNYSCTSAGNLKKHTMNHSGEKPFSCTQCKYSCTKAHNLKTHMQTHSGEKPFSCKQCNNTFTTAGNLKNHMLTDSGEKPFRCEQCDYFCALANVLMKHKHKHTGEKPFTCKQCNYSCKVSDELKKHIRKHSVKTNAWKARMF